MTGVFEPERLPTTRHPEATPKDLSLDDDWSALNNPNEEREILCSSG
jgi:hypothetical protein